MKKGIRLLQGLFLSYIITGIVLLIFSFFMYKMAWGEKMIRIGIVITYILSTVSGGFYIGRKVENRRILYTFLFGICYIAVIFLASFFLYPEQTVFSGNSITILCLCISGAILGGILS